VDAYDCVGTAQAWAQEEFGHANVGDARRTNRLVNMAASAALFPSGKLTDVFQTSATRQGAYKFVENESVEAEAISEAAGLASAKRCADEPFVFVAVDGTSINLTDRAGTKDFGTVGSFTNGARGMQLVAAIAVDLDGVPIGLTSMQWWNRLEKVSTPRKSRAFDEKELRHWGDACLETCARFAQEAPECKLWFLTDREGDAWELLQLLDTTEHWYTVRGNHNRRVKSKWASPKYIFDKLAPKHTQKGSYKLHVSGSHGRTARTARINIHTAQVTLLLKNSRNDRIHEFPVRAIYVREAGKVPPGEERIEWLLYTNYPAQTMEDTLLVVHGYMYRWRIEDLFRVWKSGACNVESTQLQTTKSVKIWANMLASVAARIERLKHLAREKPNLPATEEFAQNEIDALVLLKRQRKKNNEVIGDETPTIAQAVLWLAELGGYTGKSSGGPPGSVTIARGLERLEPAAEMLRLLSKNGRLK
jgi:hypothetical protein